MSEKLIKHSKLVLHMQKTLTFTQLWYRRLQNLTAIKPATTRGRAIIRYQEKKCIENLTPRQFLGSFLF